MTILAVLKLTMSLTLAMMAVVEYTLTVSQTQALNTVLNLASLAILMGGLYLAPRAFKAKAMEAELKEKDRIIQTRTQLADAADAAEEVAREKLGELGGLLDEARHDAASWEARYHEQERYTAGPALAAIQDLMTHSQKESERRHLELLMALRALRHLVPGAPSLDED